jgi:formate-dependent nitrite reductase cytochrome c552 subunit
MHGDNDVGCLDCHKADADDTDAFDHNGETIAIIVSPKDCASCHEGEVAEFSDSHHAQATQFIGSLDNFLGVAVEGNPAAVSGCEQCHGSSVVVAENGQLDPKTWPNTGMGRINPDGSNGSCSACHARHDFSAAQARQPENCGKCHMGPDHPQLEIFNESKHGILFAANKDEMNLDSDSWIVGQDYSAAPTCATCHMSATPDQATTHDIGTRISWTLRPVVSTKFDDWEVRRDAMEDVCTQCHSQSYVDSFYQQFDEVVELYNNKFAVPAKGIMDQLKAEGLVTVTPFDEEIEWTYFELWHHEGRRARHGAAMMGPDFVQWHGFYEVANNFYNHFLPQAEELKPGIAETLMGDDYHRWRAGLSDEEMQELLQFYEERYGE